MACRGDQGNGSLSEGKDSIRCQLAGTRALRTEEPVDDSHTGSVTKTFFVGSMKFTVHVRKLSTTQNSAPQLRPLPHAVPESMLQPCISRVAHLREKSGRLRLPSATVLDVASTRRHYCQRRSEVRSLCGTEGNDRRQGRGGRCTTGGQTRLSQAVPHRESQSYGKASGLRVIVGDGVEGGPGTLHDRHGPTL